MTTIVAAIAATLAQAARLTSLLGRSADLTQSEIDAEVARIKSQAIADEEAELGLLQGK